MSSGVCYSKLMRSLVGVLLKFQKLILQKLDIFCLKNVPKCKSFSHFLTKRISVYPNGPKFSDRQALANSADPDQTAPRGAV